MKPSGGRRGCCIGVHVQQKAAEAQRNKAPTRPDAVRPVNARPDDWDALDRICLGGRTPESSATTTACAACNVTGNGETSVNPDALAPLFWLGGQTWNHVAWGMQQSGRGRLYLRTADMGRS